MGDIMNVVTSATADKTTVNRHGPKEHLVVIFLLTGEVIIQAWEDHKYIFWMSKTMLQDKQLNAEIFDEISKSLKTIEEAVRGFEFKSAVDAILALASFGNVYIANKAPWKLLKEDVGAAEQVLKNCLQLVKACALVIQPVMPESAQKLWEMLGYSDKIADHPISDALVPFENTELGDVKPLFARIEDKQREELEATLAKRCKEAQEKAEGKESKMTEIEPLSTEIVSIDDVAKLDLRVGLVVKCEKVPKADRLLSNCRCR